MPIQKGPANLGTGSVDSTELASTLDLSAKTVTYRTIVAGDIASNAITTAKITDANITPAKMANSGAEFGMRNRIINGAMVIDQRNAGASVTFNDGVYSVDRWRAYGSQTSKLTAQQLSSSPPTGFNYYMGITSSSAYSIGAGDYFGVGQTIEGFNIGDLGWGTANAKTITLSFQVYSSLTGTFGGALRKGDASLSYPFTYSIPTANTWTTISVTIVGPTTGTWTANNSAGVTVIFGLGVGSTYSGTAGAWAAGNYITATGATSVVGTNGATFYITGVQLEKGSTATSFDYRPYDKELASCQRYYEIVNTLLFTSCWANTAYMTPFRTTKRTSSPTITTIPSSGSGAAFQVYGVVNGLVLFQTAAHSGAAGGQINMSDEL